MSDKVFEVVCPVRNGGPEFMATLTSLNGLSGENIELLISDNYSDDGCPWRTVLDAMTHIKWRVIKPPRPMGRVEHWNFALENVRGDYIKPVFVGDTLPSSYVKNVRAQFAKQHDLALIFTPFVIMGTSKASSTYGQESGMLISKETYLDNFSDWQNIFGPISAITFTAQAVKSALPFERKYEWNADWRFYVKCLEVGKAMFYGDEHVEFNQMKKRFSSSFKAIFIAANEDFRFFCELSRLSRRTSIGKFALGVFSLVIWQTAFRFLRYAKGRCRS